MTTEEKEDSSTLRIETSENDSTKPTNEKKVVVTPISKTEYRQSQAHHSSSGGVKEKQQKSIATKAKGVGQSFKT